ncbi:MAG: efflux RND transporter periplasmic adaptor subunit [Sideroxydans sp.]|nr:efflux RND transporter periplasmic adaptor subunit [Sideroxydans sp.]
MNKTIFTCLLLSSFSWQNAMAADEITLKPEQINSIGISTLTLSAEQPGELSGMPAQVTVPSNQLFVITSPLPALVEQATAGVGDTVKKGQLLARLQSPALAEAQRGLLQASTQEQLAKDNLARDDQLWKEGIISESRYRTTKSLYIEAHAALMERRQMLRMSGMSETAITKLQEANNPSSLLAVTSPIDGVVLEKTVSAGQRLDAAMPLFKVAKLEPLSLEIQVPLNSMQGLRVGATVTIPAYSAQGKLIAIGRGVSGTNQSVMLRALIDQGTNNLRAGQFVEASIETTATNVGTQWNVPNSALARIAGKAVVFVETTKGFRPESVTVVHEGAQNSVISGNLKQGEKIAVHGVSALKASMMGIGGGE